MSNKPYRTGYRPLRENENSHKYFVNMLCSDGKYRNVPVTEKKFLEINKEWFAKITEEYTDRL